MTSGPDATEWIGGDEPEGGDLTPVQADLTYMDVDEDPLATTFAPGETIADKYELKELLGRGGFGSVYRAHHQDLGHDVAIKVLNPGIAQNAQAQQRFLKEVQSQTAFVHKYAVQVRDFGRDKDRGCLYFTMDLVEGPTLRQVIEAEGRLAPQRAARLGIQVLEALEEAHKAGLVHRDLKPGNLILTEGADGEEVRILDFGIAKAVDSAGDSSGMTRTGTTLGTLRYMSPEQADGARLDGRSDLYSLGVLLFESLSGTLPIEASPQAENASQSFLVNLLTRDPARLQDVAPGVDPALAVAVMTALAKKPDDRYPDAVAFRAALSDLVAGLSDAAPATGDAPAKGESPGDFRADSDPRAAQKLALLALGVLLAGVVFWKAFETGPQRDPLEGSNERTAGQAMTYQDFAAALERLLGRRNADATLVVTETFSGRKVTFTGNAKQPLRLELEKLQPRELDALRTLFAPAPSKTGAAPSEPPFTIAGDRFTMSFDRDPLRAAKAVVGIFRRVYQAPPGARFTVLER